MSLPFFSAAYHQVVGRPLRKFAKSMKVDYPALKLECPTTGSVSCIFIIGSSVIARWPTPNTLPAIFRGIEGLDTYDLVANINSIYTKLDTNDVLMCYCGSNDFFDNLDTTRSINNLIAVFEVCKCKIVYLKVIYSPRMRYFVSRKTINAFNTQIESYLCSRNDCSMAVTLDLQRRDFGWDGVHLSKQGYETLEDIIRKETDHLWP